MLVSRNGDLPETAATASPERRPPPGWGAAVGCGWSSSLKAQDIGLRPYVGLSLSTRVSVQNGLIHLGQRLSLTVGSRLTWNQRFQVVTGIGYSPGYRSSCGG